MKLSPLIANSPIDGRYRKQVEELSDFFSEYALFRYRVMVEVEYFIALCELPLPSLKDFDGKDKLRSLYQNFTEEQAAEIKDIERTTNHDVKAVEYFIKTFFDAQGWQAYREFIHFGLTSQDVNNTAVPRSLKDALEAVYFPALERLVEVLRTAAREWSSIAMLAHTHGQPASPTRLGKEIRVFVERIAQQTALVQQVPYSAKFGGATGNFNAHAAAYPAIDWNAFADKFVHDALHLTRAHYTTQIEHYDHLAALFDGLKRINTILLDFCRDMWTYISMEYFKQQIKAGEVGSSAMPHKVNPIDFENAEGNIGIANALYEHFSAKLPVSRLQRDLTDSTVLRNIGVPLAHSLIALKSIQKGMAKLIVNRAAIDNDLNNNWAVVAEGIQTILRREGYPNPYETLKALTRTNDRITQESIRQFVDELHVDDAVKKELTALTPHTYTGIINNE
ncbi:MAG: adenylosuccinate lyase [Prevotellaceae bacterium]|jgi:adenylosuccinate lyase|nr:adenylosuccinate lyase [Prevotellaceae bacterium]